jgi:hypothetical protein
MVDLMTSGRSLVLIVFALKVASGGLAGCVASSVPESISSVAARFIVDLGRADGAALMPWLRPQAPVQLQRRCPDCPASRRVVDVELSGQSGGLSLGSSISSGPDAEVSGDVSLLRVGEMICEDPCCRWSVGLVDHGAVHIERACFGVDETGAFLTRLIVTDG